MRKVFIVAQYSGRLDSSFSNRFVYLANLLSKEFDVEFITSSFQHSTKTNKEIQHDFPFKITFIDEPGYSKNVSVKRLYSHYIYSLKLKKYLNSREAPSVVYCSFPGLSQLRISKNFANKNNCVFIVDIQDLWPETFEKYLPKFFIFKRLFNHLKTKVDFSLNDADGIVAVSNTFLEKTNNLSKVKVRLCVYIGSVPIKNLNLDKSVKNTREIKLVYLGSLSQSYDLITAIKAFKIAKEKLKDLKLIFDIIGDGPHKKMFQDFSLKEGVQVNFLGNIAYTEVQKLLPKYDIGLNPIFGWSVASIVNKHGDYAMAGLPVLNTQSNQEYKDLLADYNCGLSSYPGDYKSLSDNIIELCLDPSQLIKMKANALKMGTEKFNRLETYPKILDLIKNLIQIK